MSVVPFKLQAVIKEQKLKFLYHITLRKVQTMKVLIVDDEPLAREELHYLIQGNSEVTEILEADGIFMAEEQVKVNTQIWFS